MILWWRTTTTAPPRIILVPIASDGLSVRRLVVYELVYRTEPTDGAVVKMQFHYAYSQWWSFVRRFLLFFDGWLMNFVILEAKYIYSIYIYIYMYHGYPGMSKQVFHQLLELDAFASTHERSFH